MQQIQPGTRLLIAILGVFTLLAVVKWQVVAGLLVVLLLLALIERKFSRVWRGLLLASPFFLTAAFLGYFHPEGGLHFAGFVVLKLLTIIVWNSWFLSALRERELTTGLQQLRVPRLIATTIYFIFRYRDLLSVEMRRLRLAREMRGGRIGQRGFRLGEYGTLGQVMGAGLVRSLDRGDRVYQAMRLRGLSGGNLVDSEQKSGADRVPLLVTVILAGIVLFIDRGGFFLW